MTLPEPRGGRRRFLGWSVTGGGAVLQLLLAALFGQSFGVYVVALTGAFGWSKAAVSTGYALAQLEGGLLGPLQGALLDRWGPRRVIAVGVLLLGAGLVMLGTVNGLAGYYAAMIVTGLGVALAGFLSVTAAIVPWFVRRRARALAIAAVGMSVGGLLVPLVAGAVEAFGWRETLFVSGAIVVAVGLPSAILMRRDPARYGQVPDGGPTGLPDAVRGGVELRVADERDFTLREALATRAFWMLSVGHAAALLVVSAVVVHLIAHLNEDRGYPLALAATVMALLTFTTIAGQLAGGLFGDRFDKRLLAIVAMVAHALGLGVLAWGPGHAAVAAFVVLHGLAWGVRGPLMGALRADYFGSRHFGAVMGASVMVVMIGQLLGPIIAGTLADVLGDYRSGFTVLAVMAAVASGSFWLATPPAPPRRRASTAGPATPRAAGRLGG